MTPPPHAVAIRTVLDAFAWRAHERPAEPSLLRLAPGGAEVHLRLTWRAWYDGAMAVAAALVDDGVGPGDTVAVLVEHGRCWPLAELGVLFAGAASCTVPADAGRGSLEAVLRDADAAACIVEGRTALRTLLALRVGASDLPGLWTLVSDVADDGVHAGVRNWDGWLADGHCAASRTDVRAELAARREAVDEATPAMVVRSGRVPAGWRVVTHGALHSVAARSEARRAHRATGGCVVVPAPHMALSRRVAGLYAPVVSGRRVVHVPREEDVAGALRGPALAGAACA